MTVRFALKDKYPIHDADHVKLAAAYFTKYAMYIPDPEKRHEFAGNVKAAVAELKVEIPQNQKDALDKYASKVYSPDLEAHIAARIDILSNDRHRDILTKIAEAHTTTTPEEFAQALETFDRKTGLSRYWDTNITDPYKATFGMEKAAGHVFVAGDEECPEAEFKKGLQDKKAKLVEMFGDAIYKELAKDPVSIFESLPITHKALVLQTMRGEC